MVSSMSSISFWTAALLISLRSSARAFARSTGWPIRATFRIDISAELYWVVHPHDDSVDYRFCPRCASPLERRLLKANEPERLVCGGCGFVFYIDPKIAV